MRMNTTSEAMGDMMGSNQPDFLGDPATSIRDLSSSNIGNGKSTLYSGPPFIVDFPIKTSIYSGFSHQNLHL